ncbi:MAG: hypothetical protein ACXVNO_06030 [Bacteroidia bacterium]
MLQYKKYFRKGLLIVTSIISIFMCGTVRAQAARITDNDLDNSRNLSVGGTILGVDVFDPNLNMFVEGKMIYRFKKELGWINANYKVAWADRMDEVNESTSMEDAVPAGGSKALKNYGFSVGYNFIKKEDFKIARATFMNRSREKSMRLPVKSYRLYGVHVGYEYFRSIMAQGSTTSYTGHVVADYPRDTIVVAGNATPMLNMKIISIGIHRQFIEHSAMEVNSNGAFTNYKNKFSSMVYADFLIGTAMVFENILVPLGANGLNANPNNYSGSYNSNSPYNFYQVDINGSYKKIPIGARLGWEQVGLGPVGALMGVEAGFRPGIMGPGYNAYIMFKLGMTFNMKAK